MNSEDEQGSLLNKRDGAFFLKRIVKRLNEEDVRCTDSNIILKIRTLSGAELSALVNMGDVCKWRNERIHNTEVAR